MTAAPATSAGVGRLAGFLVVTHVLWVVAWLLSGIGSVWLSLGVVSVVLGAAALVLDRPNTVGLLKPNVRVVAIGVLGGVLLSIASLVFYPLLADQFSFIGPQVQALYGRLWDGPGPLLALPVFLWIIFAEEIIWRGSLQTLLEGRFGRIGAAVLGTVPYALAQGGQGTLLLVVVAFSVGLVFALLRALTRELWAPLICHLVWDVAVMMLWPLEHLPSAG